jgi:hypothetical protein
VGRKTLFVDLPVLSKTRKKVRKMKKDMTYDEYLNWLMGDKN